MIRKSAHKTLRLWVQTLLPSAITSCLYFLIFGHVIGGRIGEMQGYQYIQFIAPGLIMMQIITSSYSASVSALYMDRFQRSIEEILVSPMKNYQVVSSYVVAGVFRGLLVGVIVACVALFFTHIHVYSLLIVIVSALLAAAVFSTAGVINAVYAKSFDAISIVPTFILTPLTYLGGVFYSVSLLPEFWQHLSLLNPIAYMVESFRYGFLKVSGVHVVFALSTMFLLFLALFVFAVKLFGQSSTVRQ